MRPSRIKITFLTGTTLLALWPVNAKSQYAVYDAASYSQMVAQIDAMARDYQKQLEQLNQAYAQTNAIIGTRGMGDFLNSDFEKSLRSSLPPSWQETLSALENADDPELRALYQAYVESFDPVKTSDIFTGTNASHASAFENRLQTNASATITSEMAFNRTAEQIGIYEQLLEKLNDSEDLKSSVDLHSRISIENGLMLSELMRLQAVQIQQKAAQENTNISAMKRSSSANRYDAAKAAQAMKLPSKSINFE